MAEQDQSAEFVDAAVAEGGAYEIIRKRLVEQGRVLQQQAQLLNESRLEEFGSSGMELKARVRIRTENNCVARDIVQVGETLSVWIQRFHRFAQEKSASSDVFSLFRVSEGESGLELEPVELEGSFLAQPGFVNDFEELYRYYKHTRLIQLAVNQGKLLAAFQIGERLEDIRVFRWTLSPDGRDVTYQDNRGERDIAVATGLRFRVDRDDSRRHRPRSPCPY